MIPFAPRATTLALSGILLAATAALAQNPGDRQTVGPQLVLRNPAVAPPSIVSGPPAVPTLQEPPVEQPSVESLPAYEDGSPFAGSEFPSYPDAQGGGLAPPAAADSPYSLEPNPATYGPRIPQQIRSYLDNRPRQKPLQTESWLNRPYSASFFVGGMFLDNPRDDPLAGLQGDAGVMFGGRIGWDFAPYFGLEGRMGTGSVGVSSTVFNADLQQAGIFFADLNWLWYPTGDTRWRPYFSAGTGMFNIDVTDIFDHRFHNTLFEIPFGIGLKYRYSTRTVMRVDFTDNFAAGTGLLEDMHNLSFTAGLETRFGGGSQKSYWPWKPDRNWR